jgi:hypothetical protein
MECYGMDRVSYENFPSAEVPNSPVESTGTQETFAASCPALDMPLRTYK